VKKNCCTTVKPLVVIFVTLTIAVNQFTLKKTVESQLDYCKFLMSYALMQNYVNLQSDSCDQFFTATPLVNVMTVKSQLKTSRTKSDEITDYVLVMQRFTASALVNFFVRGRIRALGSIR
jgi:aminoglycoside phosphotransferase family enzyme